MSRPKGLPKTGGRVRGTPNKQSDAIARKIAKLGCDPIEGLARIALDPETKPELRVRCFTELAQYVYPKRKAVDSDSDGEFGNWPPRLSLGNLPMPSNDPVGSSSEEYKCQHHLDISGLPMPKVGFSERTTTTTPTATTATPKPSELLAQTGKVPETVLQRLRALEADAERGESGCYGE
jgi:hypothetical protein